MAELVVTTLDDELNDGATIEASGGAGLSLREALGLAVNGDTVVFQDGLSGTIRIEEALRNFVISSDVTIYGDDRITISGDSNGDDTLVNGVTDIAGTAASELDDNQKIFALYGGLSNVVLDGLTLTGGRGQNYGGAIDTGTSDLTVTRSTFAGNVVEGGLGGGAIYSYGNLTVSDSAFFGNIAINGDNGGAHGGGAIFSYSGSLNVINSTFVGNQALQGDTVTAPSGGAIFSNGGVNLNNVTMTGNLAEFQGGGLFAKNTSGDVTITNSIILGNKATVTVDGFGNEIDGSNAPAFTISNSVTDGDDASAIFAQTETINGRVAGVAADNGGPVQTVALNATLFNPAIDAAGVGATDTDARGIVAIDQPLVASPPGSGGNVFRDLGAFELTGEVEAGSLVVTTTADGFDGSDGETSLREAVVFANQQSGADTITFADGVTGLLRLSDGQIEITDALTIQGGGTVTLSGDAAGDDDLDGVITNIAASEAAGVLVDNTRVLSATADLTLDGLIITGGRVTTDQEDGGGVVVRGADLTILNSTIAGNYTTGFNGYGGGAYATGAVTVTNSVISNNQTTGYGSLGGGVFGNAGLTITDSTIRDNSTTQERSFGGGGGSFGDVTVSGSTISGNMTTGDTAQGGGLHSLTSISITGSTIADNSTNGEGASGAGIFGATGVTADTSTFYGNRQLEFDSQGGAIYSGGDVTLTHVTITNNGQTNSGNFGGGVYFRGSATVTNSLIIDNQGSGENGDLSNASSSYSSLNSVTFVGANLISAGAADAVANIANVDAANGTNVFVGGLADNGGPVQTVALFASRFNPAIDAATTAGNDARGEARIDLAGVDNGGPADLGAYEVQPDEDMIAPFFNGVPFFGVGETLLSGLNFTPVIADDLTALTYSIDSGADAGAVAIDPSTGVLSFVGSIDFENPSDANGDNRFEFTVRATDQGGNSATDNITIDIDNVNEAPAATAATAFGDEDTEISGMLTAADEDGDTLTFTQVSGPANGSLMINANGSFTFTPDADFNGTDSFTFRASDGELSDTATATITVNPVDEPVVPVDPVDPVDPVGPIDPVDPPAPAGPTAGDDTLIGTALNDTINALAGNDNVSGLGGDDLLLGGGGDDSIKGAAGDDRLRGNGGDDTLKGGGGNDNLKGNGGEDVIRGNGGDDVIRAGGAADNVKGGGGADLIFGGGGADQLNGGGGADTLRGNGGDDTLKGNGGADVFQFRASDRNDTISDFRQGQDKIQIQSGTRTFEALSIEQDGRDVLIGFGAGQVRVVTDNAGAFDESDFIF